MKRYKLYLLFCSVCAIFFVQTQTSYAQKVVSKLSKAKPLWLSHSTPKPSNNSFEYQITECELPTLSQAQTGCFVTLSSYVERRDNVQVSSVNNLGLEYKDGQQNEYLQQDFEYKIDGEVGRITSRKYDEYWECIQYPTGEIKYRCHSLFAVAKNQNVSFDDLSFTHKYGARGFWRSAIIPGWGQLYKGSTLKGSLMLGGVALAAIGAVYSNSMADDYYSKMSQTYDVSAIRSYKTKGDQFASARNVCIGVAGALYVYNLIDAMVAPGAKRIKVKRRKGSGDKYINYSFAPSISTDKTMQISTNLTF